jgi:hypothetical protein
MNLSGFLMAADGPIQVMVGLDPNITHGARTRNRKWAANTR